MKAEMKGTKLRKEDFRIIAQAAFSLSFQTKTPPGETGLSQ
jgi:hypothetical protein